MCYNFCHLLRVLALCSSAVTQTHHVHSIQLGFCPGLTAFTTDFMAVECSVGVMGLQYKWKNQKTNQVEKGTSRSGGANFKINLLSINLGMTFYL